MSDWISVKKQYPALGQEVLIRIRVDTSDPYHNIENAVYKGDGRFIGAWCSTIGEGCAYKVDHWMPRPAEPEGE